MPSIWLQMWSCLPLWIAVATMVAAGKAVASPVPAKRRLWWQWAIVLGFTLVTSWLWANPRQMIFYSGPFAGKVVDAETGAPVPTALLVFNWGGTLGSTTSQSAWTLTGEDGGYRLDWQGLANWRIGAWPGPDSFFVLAPGYANGQFFLDGMERNPYGDYDATAKSAIRMGGNIRLHRLSADTKFNFATRNLLFGIGSRSELLRVANRFYAETYPRLCPGHGMAAEWAATDLAFQQLYSLVSIIDPAFYTKSMDGDTDTKFASEKLARFFAENNTPRLLDEPSALRFCSALKLPDRGDQ